MYIQVCQTGLSEPIPYVTKLITLILLCQITTLKENNSIHFTLMQNKHKMENFRYE